MRTRLLFAFLLFSALSFGQGTGEVIITEIYNRPQKPTQEQLDAAIAAGQITSDSSPNEGHTEWFEIYNTTDAPVVMDGWTLTDASSSSHVTTIGSFTIGAHEYAALAGFQIPDAQGGVVFDYIYDYKSPSFNNESTYSGGSTSNCPDGVIIAKADGTLVDQVLYDYGYGSYIVDGVSNCSRNTTNVPFGIPEQGGSSRVSFMLKDDQAAMTAAGNDLAENWVWSTLVYDEDNNQKGTPGAPNNTSVLAINSLDNAMSYSIYPNPVKDFIMVKANNFKVTGIDIFSLEGKKVLSQKGLLNNGINVSNLKKGVYLINIRSDENHVTRKIVIE